jgi:hypothetical protein
VFLYVRPFEAVHIWLEGSLDRGVLHYFEGVDLEFSGVVWEWRGPAPYFFVTVPDEESALIQSAAAMVTYGWGMIPVEAEIGSSQWKTSLFAKDGGYVVPLKDAIRRAEGIGVNDMVHVLLSVAL